MSLELSTQRRLTKAFIDTQPVSLALVPRNRVKTPAGGYKFEDQPARAPQVLRLIEPGAYGGPLPRPEITLDGVQRTVEFELLGEHDAVIGLYDTFQHPIGIRWEVVNLSFFNGWEQRALVSRIG